MPMCSRFLTVITVLSVLVLMSPTLCSSQVASLVYKERETNLVSNSQVWTHPRSGERYLFVTNWGVYALDSNWTVSRKLEGVDRMDAFQFLPTTACSGGDIAIMQKGSGGSRLLKIDENGEASVMAANSEYDFSLVTYPITLDDGIISTAKIWSSVNCGESWFADDVPMWQSQNFSHSMVGSASGSHFWYLANRDNDSAFVATPVPRNLPLNAGTMALGRGGQVVWFRATDKADGTDTMCYGRIGDTTSARCEPCTFSDPKASIEYRFQVCGTPTSSTVGMDHTGKLYEFVNDTWTYRQMLPPPSGYGFIRQSGNYLVYQSRDTKSDSTFVVTIDLTDASLHAVHRIPALDGVLPYKPIDASATAIIGNSNSYYVLDDNASIIPANSMVRSVDVLKPLPIICGVAQRDVQGAPSAGKVLVTNWYDRMIEPQPSSVGHVRGFSTRGEWSPTMTNHAPFRNSTTGLRTPFAGEDEIIYPGARTLSFSRKGEFRKQLENAPSTKAIRMADGRLAIANGTVLRCLRDSVVTDSVDMRSLFCDADSLRSGYISSLQTFGDSIVVALVNGLRMEDSELLEVHPFACGGVAYSTDAGRTWHRSNTAFDQPYFLGMTLTPQGNIVASYTILIRDTASPHETHEATTHRMEDRIVVMSTDKGVSWTEVYRSPVSRSFRLLGGDGISLRDGRILLMTVDDALESTDGGLTWDFHYPNFTETANIISLFTNDDASAIYYCTDVGLFRNDVPTSVGGTPASTAKVLREANKWSTFTEQWARSNRECLSLTSVCGDSFGVAGLGTNASGLSAYAAPSPGLYLATLRVHNVVTTTPILVLSE